MCAAAAARARAILIHVCLLSLVPASVSAAEQVAGTVRDSFGGAVRNAEVLLVTPGMTVVATARPGEDGTFALPAPVAGSYLVIVRAPHFTELREALVVGPGRPLRLDLVLQIGRMQEDVTVAVARESANSLHLAAQPVSVITREEIADRAKTVVAQAVEGEPGVHLQRTSPTMAGVFVRGLTGNKVNVFVDGVRYSNGAQRGGVNTFLDLIEADALETIEIVRGPSSAEYGSDAIGGSVQFFSKAPMPGAAGSPRWRGTVTASAGTGQRFGGAAATVGFTGNSVALVGTLGGRRVGRIRPGGGVDSHAAVTRFFGLPSTALMDERLPDTGFRQAGGTLRASWMVRPATNVVAGYMRTVQDGGDRYDQLLGGDGNLIAELNGLSLDLFSLRVERLGLGPLDHASITYSLNSQREERVNQGGNGNPAARIGHEPERTTVNGITAIARRQISARQSLSFGGDGYFETLASRAFDVDPLTNLAMPRRPRIPDGARFRQAGVYAHTSFDAVVNRLRLAASIRYGSARYQARAEDSPVVPTGPLWPDDELGVSAATFRASAVYRPANRWVLLGSVSRGFRAPHMTDLGTLGLTGSGFEVAAPDVAGLGGFIGTTAGPAAESSGRPVEQVGPETSVQYEASVRYAGGGWRTEFSAFANDISDNIQKQALILPPGAVGLNLGGQPVVAQTPSGAVFVAASTAPVLVRANFDRARVWGIEYAADGRVTTGLSLRSAFTYLRARDTATGLPPNIEGGTPAPQAWVAVRYARAGRRWWTEPYTHFAWAQGDLSSLDLADRRIGASRSRSSIQAFFRNGARARGWNGAGADGSFNTADDVLLATGETLAQIQDRVLGPGVNSSFLFTTIPGYVTVGIRGGARVGEHEILIDLENLTDANYRGVSGGVDGPGRGLSIRYVARF